MGVFNISGMGLPSYEIKITFHIFHQLWDINHRITIIIIYITIYHPLLMVYEPYHSYIICIYNISQFQCVSVCHQLYHPLYRYRQFQLISPVPGCQVLASSTPCSICQVSPWRRYSSTSRCKASLAWGAGGCAGKTCRNLWDMDI